MTKNHFFVNILDQIYGVLNYEQQSDGSNAFVMCPIRDGRLHIYEKLQAKGWPEAAIHERLFPRSHIDGKWTPFCSDNREHLYVQEYMSWSKDELIDAIRVELRAQLVSIDALSKHDLAVMYRHIKDSAANLLDCA